MTTIPFWILFPLALVGALALLHVAGGWFLSCLAELRRDRSTLAVSRAFDRGYLEGLKAAERTARKQAADAMADEMAMPADAPNHVPQF